MNAFKKIPLYLIAASVAGVACAPCVRASAVDFGQTTLSADSGQGDFVFTNNGTSASWTTIPGGAPANFYFEGANINGTLPSDLTGDLPVHIVLNAATSTPAGSIFGGLYDVQPIDSGTVQVLLDTPINGQDNVLTVNFQDGSISGADGGATSAFDVQDGNAGGTASFTSDFLNFGGSTTGNVFYFGSSNANPGISIDGNFLASFVDNGLSTFSYDNANASVSVVPEPTTLGLLTLGLPLLLKRRRRA